MQMSAPWGYPFSPQIAFDMRSKTFRWHSLNTRVTLSTLLIFVISIWSLAFYASRLLHVSVERASGEQQFSTVSFIAADLNDELNDRLKALETIAVQASPAMRGNAAALQALIEQHRIFQLLFNAGTFVTGIDGIAIASIPILLGRVGVSYLDRDFMAAALKDGKSTIGRPVMGKQSRFPIFVMAVPIRDTQGKVIGALAGVTDLAKPNFLDKIAATRYGKSGGYLLNAPQYGLIVTASDTSRIMQPLPPPGVNKMLDRYIEGFEGYGVSMNSRGVEELTASKGIPAAGWFLGIVIPTEEAFSPIHDMLQSLLLATLFVTLTAGALTWWMLRRQLAPMLITTKALATLAATNQPPQPLPVTTQDEIGDLIGGFNRLLETLERKNVALAEIAAKAKRFSDSLDNITSCYVSMKDSSRKYIYANKATLSLFKRSAEELVGSGDEEFFPPDTVARLKTVDERVLESGESTSEEIDVSPDSQERRVYLEVKSPLIDDGGRIIGLCGISTDITERKQAEAELVRHRDHLEELVFARTAELAQSRDAAEAANRAKTIFLATMSHEMRTPMNGVMGMIDLVLMRATDPKQIDWLNKSKSSARHLLDVINDILDISQIEGERLVLVEKNFSLAQVVDDIVQMQGGAAQAKGLGLSCEIAPALPALLCGDATRLRQMLINFTGNAIKFSNHGQVTVSVHAIEEDKLSVLLRIEVTDQGIGISPEQQARLFQAFTQADGSMNREYGGTGLGLIICKRIALLMDGDAGVISEEGQGSTFWATARFRKGAEVIETPSTENVDAEAIIEQRYCGQRILVVDDEPVNREIVLMRLEAVDLVVDTAVDGTEAVALAQKNRYAAILMDMQMPKLNGLEATREIRRLPGYRHTPIVAMTANAFAEDKAKCMAAGMNDFLIKPFNPDQLFAVLLRALNQRDV